MLPYMRPHITALNVSDQPIEKLKELEIMAACHLLCYTTEFPKKLVMWNNLDNNPYHLFFYMLAKFYTVDNEVDTIEYYYPKTDSHIANEAMRLLPKRFQRKYEKEEGYEYVQIPGLEFYADSIGDKIVYSYIRNLFKDIYTSTNQENGKYIYISRKYTNSRKVLNEEELVDMLKGLGISVYYLESMTFIDTIRLFKSAQFVTGSHGAGLAWAVFCDPKAFMLEVYKNKPLKNCYYHVCKEIGLEYWRFTDVIADKETEETDPNLPDNGNIYVPVESYKAALETILSKVKERFNNTV